LSAIDLILLFLLLLLLFHMLAFPLILAVQVF
jgi:hypothetical protein